MGEKDIDEMTLEIMQDEELTWEDSRLIHSS